jgi:hypothetical protein
MTIRRPSLFQFWILISALWLIVAGVFIVENWSDKDWKEDPFVQEAPDSWREQHPECRDRYGIWPNGEQMDDSEFEVLTGIWMRELSISLLKDRGVVKTPKETDRDKWASDVRSKISACERPQWLQDEKAAAQESKRNGLVAFALLPPLLLLSIGSALIAIWRLFVKVQWLKTPEHIRSGLVRLYIAVSVPWVAWFGYHLLDALRRDNQRLIADAFWELLFIPVGFPIVTVVILWVVGGFREPKASK